MDEKLGPDDFELGEDVTEVARNPSGKSGLVVSIRFEGEEADELLRRVSFEEELPVAWCKAVILEKVYEQTWVKYIRVSA